MHKGLPISYWLDRACTGFDANTAWPDRMEVKNIGPAAVPMLVDQLRVTDRWRSTWNSWRTHLPASWQRRFPAKPAAKEIHYGAARTLAMFGPAAKPAVPDLVRLLPEIRNPALDALTYIGPDAKMALPVLRAMLTNTDSDLRVQIARALWEINRETNTVLQICTNVMVTSKNNLNAPGALIPLGTNAAPAVPLALAALEDTNRQNGVLANSAIVLGVSRVDTPEIRAALLAGMQEGNDGNLRCNCALALWDLDPQYAPLATRLVLEEFVRIKKLSPGADLDITLWLDMRGLDPRESIPTLKQLTEDESDQMRDVAKRTLEIIEKKSNTAKQ